MITRTLPGFTANASLYRTSGHYRTDKRAINLRVQQMGTMRLSAIDVPGEVIEIEDDAPWSPPSWGGHTGPGSSGPPSEPGGGGGDAGGESSSGEPPEKPPVRDKHGRGCTAGQLRSKWAKPCTDLRKLEMKDHDKNPHYVECTGEKLGDWKHGEMKCCQQKDGAKPTCGRLN